MGDMDTDYYLGFDDSKGQALLDEITRQEDSGRSPVKRRLATAASALALAALAVGAYVAAPSGHDAVAARVTGDVLMADGAYDTYDAYGGTTTTTTTTTTGVDAYGVTIPEGRAVKCGLFALEYFRYSNGQRRWYPSIAVALSWDPSYLLKFSVVNCNKIPRGTDMALKLPSPSSYADGQAIKCDASQAEVYRLVGGTRRWYPTPTIATSWDPNWGKFVVVDCSSLTKGDDMLLNPKSLPEGQSVQCPPSTVGSTSTSASLVFRLVAGKRCWFPTTTIAASWDLNWSKAPVVDCSVVPTGENLLLNPKTLPEGQAIKCSTTASEIFRIVSGKRCWYPTPAIASSWDANWSAALAVDCSVLTRGDDLLTNPKSLSEGQAVKCSSSAPEVFRMVAGKRCWYPTPDIATSWDGNWGSATVVDCTCVARGTDMQYNPSKLPEGQAIKCSASEATVYRLTGGKRCGYPSEAVATSWDANWKKFLVVDCTSLPVGIPLLLNPKGLPEGQAIKCAANEDPVYRIINSQRCWYPNPEIATSWDANWRGFLVVDCSVLPRGPDLYRHPRGLPDGSTIKCENKPELYRLVGSARRLYSDLVIAKS